MPSVGATIYLIKCKDSTVLDCYVGSSIDFTTRQYNHRHICKNENHPHHKLKVYECIRQHGGFDNWEFIQIAEAEVDSKRELFKLEREYQEQFSASLNSNMPYRTPEEKIKFHREYYQKYYHRNTEYRERQLKMKKEKYRQMKRKFD